MQLNNYLQETYKNQTTLRWDTQHSGLEHQGTWKAIALINHVEYGWGTATTLDDAKEEAARQSLVNLRGF